MKTSKHIWRILVSSFKQVMDVANVHFKFFRRKIPLLAKRNGRISICLQKFCALIIVTIYVDAVVDTLLHAAALQSQIFRRGRYMVTSGGVLGFLVSLGSVVCQVFDCLQDGKQEIQTQSDW